jgi:hypothetical protein
MLYIKMHDAISKWQVWKESFARDPGVWKKKVFGRSCCFQTEQHLASQESQLTTTEPIFIRFHECVIVREIWMRPGMAVLPGGRFLATACPDEIRGWVRLLALPSHLASRIVVCASWGVAPWWRERDRATPSASEHFNTNTIKINQKQSKTYVEIFWILNNAFEHAGTSLEKAWTVCFWSLTCTVWGLTFFGPCPQLQFVRPGLLKKPGLSNQDCLKTGPF